MKRHLLGLLCLLFTSASYAQVNIVENFNSGSPAGWTDTYDNTTSQTCAGNSERDNLYSGSTTGNMTTPNQVGASNGTDITFSIDYKVVDWSAATNPTADGWGSADLQYSTDDGANWMTAGTIDDSNDSNSNVCMTFTVTIPGASVPMGSDLRFRVLNTWLAGDYYFYIDDFTATQPVLDPPNCDAALTSNTTDFPIDGTLTWSVATGIPDGYKLSIGTAPGGMDVLPETDLGNTTSYDASGLGLMYGTTYYAFIVPYNANGDAGGCAAEAFMTEADPNMMFTVNCGSSLNTTHCYDNNDATTFLYTSSDGTSPLKMTFNAGGIESCCDDIRVYDGTDNTATVLYDGNNGGDLAMLEITATGPNIFMEIDSDGSVSCQNGSTCCTTQWDWDVECLSCNPGAGSAVLGACDAVNGISIDVTVSDIGDGTIIIANDGGVGSTTVMATGTYTVGPFAFSSTITITLEHPTDPTCNVVLTPLTLPSGCPPANDDCGGAINLMVNADLDCGMVTPGTIENATASPEDPSACSGTEDDDVWFAFQATATEHKIDLLNVAGSTADLYHSLWEGTCGSLTLFPGSCSDPNSSTVTGLTPGTVYYLRVYSWTATSGQTSTFDVCIGTNPPPPAEDVCGGAIVIPVTADMCTGITTGNNAGATDSDLDVPAPPAATCSSYAGGDIWFTLTVPASGNVTISGANSDGCCSYLWYEIYSGADCSALTSIGCSDTNSGTDNNDPSTYETVLTGLTPGSMIWIRAWDSSNDNGPGDFNFCAYEPSCAAPTASIPADPIDFANCPTTVDVTITIDDLGDSGTLTISAEDDMGNPAGTGGMVTMTGPFTITNIPVPQTSWTIKIAHESNATCDIELGPFLLNCPPANDNVCDAEAIIVDDPQIPGNNAYSTFETNESDGSCWAFVTAQNSVWYSFISPGSGLVEITTDFVTGLNDSQIALYEGTDCNDLTTFTEIGCDEDGGVVGNGWMSVIQTTGAPLTGGQMYYVQVDGYGAAAGDFEIQVKELPPANDECANAAILAENTTGSLIDQYFGGATASGMGAEICDVAGTPTPNDVWYSINTDADGGNLIVVVEPGPNSDVVVAIYDACGSPIPEQCVDLGGNGGIETINFLANVKDPKSQHSSTRDADYFVRVYEKIPSDQPFEIGAQGEALPIVLGSFEAVAEKRGNRVMWSTLSEINSAFVEVQSSPNGSTKWEVIGEVGTRGESTSKVDYELFDYNPYEVTYYRLNAVDKDGKAELSQIINVRRSDVRGQMTLAPNPAYNQIAVQKISEVEEVVSYGIIDNTGKLVLQNNYNMKLGMNTINIELDDLPSGIYLFRLQTSDGVQVEKFVKQ